MNDEKPGLPAADPMPPKFIHHVAMKCEDIEEAQSFLSRTYAPLRIPGGSQDSFDFEALALHCGGVSFSSASSRSGIGLLFEEPFDGYGMSLPLSGSLSVSTGSDRSIGSKERNGLMMDSRTVETATFSPRSAWQRITLGSEELHRHLQSLTDQTVRRRLEFASQAPMSRGASGMMFLLNEAVMQGMKGDAPLLSSPAAIVNIQQTVLSLFVQSLPHNYSEFLSGNVALPAPRHVKRAIEFMQANVLEPIRLEHIAAAAQVSPRSLQMAFRQFRNTTPMDYLRRLRLNGARNDLMHSPPGTGVADVAYRWGFAHHGIFSAYYARTFGEPPSTTLRNHRGD